MNTNRTYYRSSKNYQHKRKHEQKVEIKLKIKMKIERR